MGQKVHPYGFRLGYIKGWHSNWYAKDNYGATLQEDIAIRKYVEKNLSNASIAKTEITRTSDQVKVTVYSDKNIQYKIALELWSIGVDSIFIDNPLNYRNILK